MATIDDTIEELQTEVEFYTNMLLNQSGFKSIQGAGNEGAKTDFTDPLKIKDLRQDARDRLAHAKLRKQQGFNT